MQSCTKPKFASKLALLTMAKRPAPGRTKTRLSPPLSPLQATGLYEAFLLDTLDLMRQVTGVQPVIAYAPAPEKPYFAGLAPEFDLYLQEGPDLGTRLDNAFSHHFAMGYDRVVIMDSDSPTLPLSALRAAFEALDRVDVTLGPCDDGGYYLIGLKRPAPRLLREVRMSTPNVLTDTLALAGAESLSVGLLTPWYDVDDAATLNRLRKELATAPPATAPNTRQFLNLLNPNSIKIS